MNLLLARHGEALPSSDDPQQSLSSKGRAETETIAQALKRTGVEIDEIIHSQKLRAKQTAEILRRIAAPKVTLIEHEQMSPLAPIEPLVEEIHTFDRTVLLVGHLPYLEKLCTQLLFGEERLDCVQFQASTIVSLVGERDRWAINWMLATCLI